ncbi:uncharacterized protein [Clytia hemisphaerica]|uniref:Uncharacterized protein n=1 Tax=Clytia hemisphaerica TaxID=252671 RepID=A0A7M5WJ77_9CNID
MLCEGNLRDMILFMLLLADLHFAGTFAVNNGMTKGIQKKPGFAFAHSTIRTTLKLKECPFNKTIMYSNKNKSLPVTRTCSDRDNNPYMELFWDKPDGVSALETIYYIVRLNIPPSNFCFGFNVSMATKLKFTAQDGFIENKSYWVSIDAFTKNRKSQILSKIIILGSCPWIGEWANWGTWSSCPTGICPSGNRQPPKTTRTRYCMLKNNNETYLESRDCKGYRTDSKNCGLMKCTTDVSSKDQVINGRTVTITTQIGIAFGVLTLSIILIVVFYRTIKNRQEFKLVTEPNRVTEHSTVYISHLTIDETQERSLLNLVHFISTYGIRPKLDILCQVEINDAGGLHNWIPDVLTKIDTVILLITKKYIEALTSIKENDLKLNEQVCKIHTEFNLIKKRLYQSKQQNPKLVILLDDKIKTEMLPKDLSGRTFCFLPKRYDQKDDERCNKLLGHLLNVEPIQIQ